MLAAPTSGPAQVAGTRGLAPFACCVFTAQQRRSNVPQQIWEPHQSVFEASLPLAGQGQGLPPQLPPMFCPPHNKEPTLAANLVARLVLWLPLL
jgi:hypothetical protein